MGTRKVKRWKEFRSQGKEDEEGIDNLILAVGLYNQDPCIIVANCFTINLPSGHSEDVRA